MKNCFITALLIMFVFSSCRERNYDVTVTPLNTGSGMSIRALHVVDENTVWASGTGGRFILTTDGGVSWYSDTIPGAAGDDLRSIYAWNEKEAMVFGTANPGKGYYTEDAGVSWKLVYENNSSGIFFNSVDFADEKRGMALSDPIDSCSFIIKTNDRASTWKKITGLPVLREGEYNFAASNSCIEYDSEGNAWVITGGADARVFKTNNDGDTWDVYDTEIISGNPSSGIFSVSFRDGKNGIIVGGTYDKPELNENIAAYSSDGGESWTLSEIMPSAFRSSVIWLSDNRNYVAFALGKTGCDYSPDNGITWIKGPDIDGYYTARAIPGTLAGFMAGSNGKIARFTLSPK